MSSKEFVCNDQDTVVNTDKGKLKGYKLGEVYAFKGIPYAKAKRFQPPEDTEPWEGIRDALCFGYTAPLTWEEALSDQSEITTPHRFWPHDENCQNLNIWTKSIDTQAKKPVVVWFHGGGFFGGSAIEMPAYEGYSLCEAENLVVVTVNHRLNVLGYLDLRKFGTKYEHAVNAGNLDLIHALRWIHDNIAAFGGDPDNVTIFGQSGGGGKVLSLMGTPAAEGLFHKAVVMSGTLSGPMAVDDIDMSPVVRRTIELLGGNADQAEILENAEYQALADAYHQAYKEIKGSIYPHFGPMVNVDYPGNPLIRGFSEAFKKTPLIIGSTYAEFSASALPTDGLTDDQVVDYLKKCNREEDVLAAISAYHEAYPQEPVSCMLHADSRGFRPSNLLWAEKRVSEKCAPTYLYLFTTSFRLNGETKAWHCADIPYFFRNINLVPVENLGEKGKKLEEAVSGAFANFARTGKPGYPSLPDWSACEDGRMFTMILDLDSQLKENYDDKFLNAMKSVQLPPEMFMGPI